MIERQTDKSSSGTLLGVTRGQTTWIEDRQVFPSQDNHAEDRLHEGQTSFPFRQTNQQGPFFPW